MKYLYSNTSVNVTSFELRQVGIGKGYSARLYRIYNIQYSRGGSTNYLPQSAVLKLSYGGGYTITNEQKFYLSFEPRISNTKIPKWYYVAQHPHILEKGLMLLEDLNINYETLESINSVEDSTLFSVIASIASVHAEFYEHPLLQQNVFTWLRSLNSLYAEYLNLYVYIMNDQSYTKLLQSSMSNKSYAYVAGFPRQFPLLFQRLSDKHYTLSHGDLWINNVFRDREQSHKMLILDWQHSCRANGLIDIAFLLQTLSTNRARFLEPLVLELYHQVLVKYGVSKYQLSEIREDYYSLALPLAFLRQYTWRPRTKEGLKRLRIMVETILTNSDQNY